MGTTPTYAWPYPEPTDPVTDGAQNIEDLALAVESTVSGLPIVSGYIDYSASMTYNNFTLGNGTVEAYYARVGDLVHFLGTITLGSTSSFSGTPFAINSLPLTPVGDQRAAGNIWCDETGVATYAGRARVSGTQVLGYAFDETGSFIRHDNVDGSTPFTWGNTDLFRWSVIYRTS